MVLVNTYEARVDIDHRLVRLGGLVVAPSKLEHAADRRHRRQLARRLGSGPLVTAGAKRSMGARLRRLRYGIDAWVAQPELLVSDLPLAAQLLEDVGAALRDGWSTR